MNGFEFVHSDYELIKNIKTYLVFQLMQVYIRIYHIKIKIYNYLT